jgi:hypothetical protein
MRAVYAGHGSPEGQSVQGTTRVACHNRWDAQCPAAASTRADHARCPASSRRTLPVPSKHSGLCRSWTGYFRSGATDGASMRWTRHMHSARPTHLTALPHIAFAELTLSNWWLKRLDAVNRHARSCSAWSDASAVPGGSQVLYVPQTIRPASFDHPLFARRSEQKGCCCKDSLRQQCSRRAPGLMWLLHC